MASSILEQDFQQSNDMMAAQSQEATDNLAAVEEGLPITPMTTVLNDASPVPLGSVGSIGSPGSG
jgi:hypothetical protein